MSATPCGCQCKAIDTVTASEGLAFLPVESPAPELAVSLPLFLVLTMATVAMALAQQRRRAWCVLALRNTEPVPRPTAVPWWKVRFSPTERRIASAVKAVVLESGAAIFQPLRPQPGWFGSALRQPAEYRNPGSNPSL